MASVVFILGAGASKRGGAPLMMEFLDAAHDLWKLGRISDGEKESFEAVFKARSYLQQAHSKSREPDIYNIESVFAAFEMANTLKQFGDYKPEDIKKLLSAMKTVIVVTIENTLLFPVSDGTVIAPPPYELFGNLVRHLCSEVTPPQTVAVITFNYDLATDFVFHRFLIPVEYGLEDESASQDAVPLLKLHGSLNWVGCSECEAVVAWGLPQYFSSFHWNLPLIKERGEGMLSLRPNFASFGHGKHPVGLEPVIVPPTWNKLYYTTELSRVWARAAAELSEAEYIFVIGYSLPESDLFFRYLYGLGTVGEAPLRRFWVFNPDRDVEARFRQLLGSGAEQRFCPFGSSFTESISIIAEEFGLPAYEFIE